MNEYMDKQKVEFDGFCDKWEKALEQGIFKDSPLPPVNSQTSNPSFFGVHQMNPTDQASQTDAEYWKAIHQVANDHAPEKMITEIMESNENFTFEHPLLKCSLGKDQALEPRSLGVTYSEEDLVQIAELKKELYDLETKLLTSMGFGDDKGVEKLKTKIESVKKELDNMSDNTGRTDKEDVKAKK